MALSRPSGWADERGRWLAPFLAALSRPEPRRWAPLYLRGLLLPGERKSIEPMAARIAPGEVQQLHHFVSASPWATEPLEAELVRAADRLVGGPDAALPDAALVVDDTALVKQGAHSVGVQRQHCGELGKRANCQALVSLTLARGEVPLPRCDDLRGGGDSPPKSVSRAHLSRRHPGTPAAAPIVSIAPPAMDAYQQWRQERGTAEGAGNAWRQFIRDTPMVLRQGDQTLFFNEYMRRCRVGDIWPIVDTC
jgi:hypothetical protein